MAQFKVNKKFKDKNTGEVHEPETVIDMTVKRANEVTEKLGDDALERVQEAKED